MPRHRWPEGLAEELLVGQAMPRADGEPSVETLWDAQHGDRRTELVCIGRELDHEAASAQMEACLLTAKEMAAGEEGWLALPDPFAPPFE